MNKDFEIKPEEYFRLSNGRVLKNLNELLNALKSMDEETFEFHVNENKNDFGNWVKDVFKDEELAKSIFNFKTREDVIDAIETRLFEDEKKEHIKIEVDKLQFDVNKIRKKGDVRLTTRDNALKPRKFIKNYPFVKDSVKTLSQKPKEMSLQKTIAQGTIPSEKIEEILMKEKEIEKREEKIEEIEARIEKELAELGAKKEPKFFSKEFMHGVLIGLLSALIIGIVYIKFFS